MRALSASGTRLGVQTIPPTPPPPRRRGTVAELDVVAMERHVAGMMGTPASRGVGGAGAGGAPPLGLDRCPSCGGVGKGLVQAHGYCDHCWAKMGGGGETAVVAGAKRSRPDSDGRGGVGVGGGEWSEAEVAAMLAAAEAAASEAPALDVNGVKRLCVGVEKRINRNQVARAKYAGEPARFMESELELDEELKKLRVLAAAPSLYPVLVATGTLKSLLGLLTHENVDIAVDVIALLTELTDDDALGLGEEEDGGDEEEEDEEGGGVTSAAAKRRRTDGVTTAKQGAEQLLDAFIAGGGLELVVQTWVRVGAEEAGGEGDASGVDGQAVFTCLSLLENLVTLRPALAGTLCDPATVKASVLELLMRLVGSPPARFDANKQYASELLAILVQAEGSGNAARFGASHFAMASGEGRGGSRVDGVEALLMVVNGYRKRDPGSKAEEEMVENVVDALCAVLTVRSNQVRFVAAEGFELLCRCVREAGFMRYGALKVCDYAMAGDVAACEAFVHAGGLKAVFPAFMGKGLAHTRKLHGGDASRDEEYRSVSICATLLVLLPHPPAGVPLATLAASGSMPGLARMRLLSKFREERHEKIDRLMEMVLACMARVSAAQAAAVAEYEEEEGEEVAAGMDAETRAKVAEAKAELIYLRRLDGGLAVLQQLCVIIAQLACPAALAGHSDAAGGMHPTVAAVLDDVAFACRCKVYEQSLSLLTVADVVAEHAAKAREEVGVRQRWLATGDGRREVSDMVVRDDADALQAMADALVQAAGVATGSGPGPAVDGAAVPAGGGREGLAHPPGSTPMGVDDEL